MALLKSIHFPTSPTTSYCRQLSVLEILILNLLKKHIHKYQYYTPTLKKRCFISQKLIYDTINIVYKGLDGQIYSNIKEDNMLVQIKLLSKYFIIYRVLQSNTLARD